MSPLAQIEGPRVAFVVVMVRHRAEDACGELDFIDVAECLFEKQDPFAVVGPVGPFAEVVTCRMYGGSLSSGDLPFCEVPPENTMLVPIYQAGRRRCST